mmetsp:Transcript_386/g.786  ORF Transcript_386/g.786 Transcript_386/m.786 type:complete len:259 (-) Transcript_386:303-1079(-)|eukprot:CAMPEP_0179000338 /NCGR_PEP_ID=MMETSP0795-20121207/10610_1 /TAXON_ID=88552 /ORGANISM="Amoebophrya sp., Strain Ameob2" /LENGTH=258 /DNA_ID=CAMNT_0020693311 /DNA_START=250 /DNA_END=1026 /DNA_ORIENTATION=+
MLATSTTFSSSSTGLIRHAPSVSSAGVRYASTAFGRRPPITPVVAVSRCRSPTLHVSKSAMRTAFPATTSRRAAAIHFKSPSVTAAACGEQRRHYARKSDGSGPPPPANTPPPPAPHDPWQEVKDPGGSGKTYWWNTETNQVTPLGAAKPLANQQQQQTQPAAPAGGGGGLMGAIADGMAFGFGSSLMHRAMDSVMGPRTMEVTHTNEHNPMDGASPPPSPPPADTGSGGGEGSYFQEESSWFGGGDDGGGGGGWFDE